MKCQSFKQCATREKPSTKTCAMPRLPKLPTLPKLPRLPRHLEKQSHDVEGPRPCPGPQDQGHGSGTAMAHHNYTIYTCPSTLPRYWKRRAPLGKKPEASEQVSNLCMNQSKQPKPRASRKLHISRLTFLSELLLRPTCLQFCSWTFLAFFHILVIHIHCSVPEGNPNCTWASGGHRWSLHQMFLKRKHWAIAALCWN